VIPTLRERREDIPLLFAHFAFQMAARLKMPFGGITPGAMEVLMEYPWPGNIRELKNFVELIVTLERGEKITEETVYRHLDVRGRATVVENPNAIIHLPGRTPEQAERELIYRALVDLRNEVTDMRRIILTAAATSEAAPAHPALPSAPPTVDDILDTLEDLRLEEMERKMIVAALKRFSGNRRAAAQALGISERTLYRKLIDYKLKPEGEE
jgi:DNA-binding NtrC family response regulator